MIQRVTKTFEIVKRNRKYFAARIADKYDCKILIDSNSSHLEPGQHTLVVEDLSIRTKYGNDLIFRAVGDVDQQIEESGICSFKPTLGLVNEHMRKTVNRLGGRWDRDSGAWIFPKIVEDQIDELEFLFNSDFINIQVEFTEYLEFKGPVKFLGYEIGGSTRKNGPVNTRCEVALIAGNFGYERTRVGRYSDNDFVYSSYVEPGTIVRLKVPAELLRRESSNIDCTIKVNSLDFLVEA